MAFYSGEHGDSVVLSQKEWMDIMKAIADAADHAGKFTQDNQHVAAKGMARMVGWLKEHEALIEGAREHVAAYPADEDESDDVACIGPAP